MYDDPLLKELLACQHRTVELIAFGISYAGELNEVNIENGYVTITDGDDKAMIELEQVKSIRLLA